MQVHTHAMSLGPGLLLVEAVPGPKTQPALLTMGATSCQLPRTQPQILSGKDMKGPGECHQQVTKDLTHIK